MSGELSDDDGDGLQQARQPVPQPRTRRRRHADYARHYYRQRTQRQSSSSSSMKTPVLDHFYPPDSGSAGNSYGPVSVAVCLSVTSRCSIKRDERINLPFGMEASFDQSYTAI